MEKQPLAEETRDTVTKVEWRETARQGYRSLSNVDLEAESEKKNSKKEKFDLNRTIYDFVSQQEPQDSLKSSISTGASQPPSEQKAKGINSSRNL